MRQKKLNSLIFACVLLLSACSLIAIKRSNTGGLASGAGTTIVVGRVVVDPQPEAGSEDFTTKGYDGQIRIFCDNVLKQEKEHEEDFWENWPLQIMGNEDYTFYYGLPNRRCYAVMAGYLRNREAGYEIIHLPVSFVIDIAPGDRAVYIGTIKFTRDMFYHIKAVKVYDEYARVLPEFIQKYGNRIRLKKALARIAENNPDSGGE